MAFLQTCLNLFLPNQCLGCHCFVDTRIPLCPNCVKKLAVNFGFYCPTCHKRLPYGSFQCSSHGSASLKAIACLFDWQDPLVQTLILNFKYHNLLPLKSLFRIYIASFLDHYSILLLKYHYNLVPIPLNHNKLRQRGFNQAEIILPPSPPLPIPIITDNLIRIKDNPPQALTVSPLERRENIIGAFAVKYPSSIGNKNIVLVDDVYTTGATLYEAANTLKRNGAKNIIGLTLAGQIH